MKFGIYRFSALGDIAASIPVFKAFEQKPTILTSPMGYELLKDEFEDIIILKSKNIIDVLQFIYRLKKEHLGLFIDLQNNDRSRFIRSFFKNIDNKGVDFDQSVTYIFYDIAKKSRLVGELDVNFTKKERSYIVLNVGSSPKWISKRLPFHKWHEFSEILYERFGLEFVLTGDKNEQEYVEELSRHIVGKKEVVAGKTNLQELKNILKNAYLTVSTDSAPMHISAVYKTPTIGLFGATNWIRSAPFGPWSVALYDKKQFSKPPKVNRVAVGDYYENIDISDGLKQLEQFL
ncbi:glycosyltransferase family 9 protein [Nitratiruptor sp. YY09-18]|uniref:glycosyltransferase family 9 protein n=1 Tax=Nitratiruptor sp. YY09-18 TaxID=2724901 RepID=UPI001915CBBF|nr:glycosyltransferase family 9 protein [Nitratiruptor sp. YY09-18]BCD67522.1 ADP-heptose:LPS heptosyltransferase II [Nitratiruptor sp. YY09-18]